jgi:hypothetical protein
MKWKITAETRPTELFYRNINNFERDIRLEFV